MQQNLGRHYYGISIDLDLVHFSTLDNIFQMDQTEFEKYTILCSPSLLRAGSVARTSSFIEKYLCSALTRLLKPLRALWVFTPAGSSTHGSAHRLFSLWQVTAEILKVAILINHLLTSV